MKRDSMYRSLESDGQTGNRLAKPPPEEPDALVAHVRVCEGPGRQRPGLLGTAQATHVLEEALHLSPLERAELIEQMFASFSFPSRQANDAEWAREAEDRIQAYDAGLLSATSAREIFARVEGMRP